MAAASLSSQKLCARRRQNQIVVCLIRTIVLMQSSPWPRVSLDGLNATEISPDPLVGAFFHAPLACINLASPAGVSNNGGDQPRLIKAEESATSEPDSRW